MAAVGERQISYDARGLAEPNAEVPKVSEVDGAKAHFEAKERCVFCDILRQETREGQRLIAENADIVAVAPYAPRFPFETWLLPRRHEAHFDNSPRHEYASLARLLGSLCS